MWNRCVRCSSVVVLLVWLWLLWWPENGALSIGRGHWQKEYGFIGYYVLENDHGHQSGRVSRIGLASTLAMTLIMSALCIWDWRRSAAPKQLVSNDNK